MKDKKRMVTREERGGIERGIRNSKKVIDGWNAQIEFLKLKSIHMKAILDDAMKKMLEDSSGRMAEYVNYVLEYSKYHKKYSNYVVDGKKAEIQNRIRQIENNVKDLCLSIEEQEKILSEGVIVKEKTGDVE